MKILLAYKPVNEEDDIEKVTTPGGLLALGTVLRESFINVKLCNFAYSSWQDIERKIKEVKPDIIGTTCYAFNRHAVFRLVKLAKLINPETKTIIGGPFATALPERIMGYCEEIDILVLGEGEKTILRLVSALKGKIPLEEVKGIVFRKEGKLVQTEPQEPYDISKQPIPAKYFKYNHIITSRGCPGQCIFCSTPRYWGNKIRFRKIGDVVKEFALLKRQGVADLIISDDTFTADRQRVLDFCSGLIKEQINAMWDCRSRYNFIDHERLTAMKKAGCYKIGYGIESGSKKILAGLKKYINPEQMVKAAEETRKAGLYQYVFLIVGSPGESGETIQETVSLVERIKPQAVLISYLHTYPGTELYKNEKEAGELGDLNWFRDEKHLPERYIYKFKERKEKLKLGAEKIYKVFDEHKEEWKLTEEELKRNIETCNFDVFSMNELGKICAKQGNYGRALEYFSQAARINRFFPSTFLNLGILHEKMERLNEAIQHYKRTIELNPQNAVALKNLGNVYCKQDKIPSAIQAYESAVLLNYPYKAQLNALIGHLKTNL